MADFIDFTHIQNAKLVQSFLSDSTNTKLSSIVKKNKKNISIKIHTCKLDNLYLVIVKGKYDNILIKLGKEYAFPRGFPVLWSPNNFTRYFGFLPKFSNDERQMVDDFSHSNITTVRFFKKWSGFLGQLLVWEYNDHAYWTACSKNAASHELVFVQEAKRLFEPFINPNLVKDMINKNLHVCAEMISKNDEVHGAVALKETPIVTVIGQRVSNSERAFVDFFKHEDVVNFCQKHSLPCDSAVTISGFSSCNLFLKTLSERRDFIDNDGLNTLLSDIQSDNLTIQKGTINHAEVQGNVLEGLVMYITRDDGSSETKKYKFPNYTIRTMLLRTLFNCSTFNNQGSPSNFTFSNALKKKAQRYVDFWCVSEEGKKYWYERALWGFMLFADNNSDLDTPKELSSIHIRIADYMVKNYNPQNNIRQDFENKTKQVDTTVIVVLGPVGSGKSTIANLLCRNKYLVEIDGDDLGLGNSLTLKLGSERNVYTQWKLIEVIMKGFVPVISTGGGALTSYNNVILREMLHSVLGVSINLIVLAPDPTINDITEYNSFRDNPNTITFYNDVKSVIEIVKRRVQTGEWELDSKYQNKKNGIQEFSKMISNLSKKNSKFCNKFMEESDYTFLFPAVNPQNHNSLSKSLHFDGILDKVISKLDGVDGNFQQVRVLCHVLCPKYNLDKYLHITLDFDFERGIEKSIQDFLKIQAEIKKTNNKGKLVSLKNGKNNVLIAVPFDKVHPDNSTHITINPGPHQPKYMKLVALAVEKKDPTVTLITKKEEEITYNIPDKFEPCTVEMMEVFGI